MADGGTAVLSVRELARSPKRAGGARPAEGRRSSRAPWLGAKASDGRDRAVPRAVLVPGLAAPPRASGARRRARHRAPVAPPGPAAAGPSAAGSIPGRPGPYRIAGVPFPERTETQHTIVSGTTGSGKTVLIADLVAQVRARG